MPSLELVWVDSLSCAREMRFTFNMPLLSIFGASQEMYRHSRDDTIVNTNDCIVPNEDTSLIRMTLIKCAYNKYINK